MDSRIRSFFEPRFGHDFSRVRVHTGHTAAQSARSVHASAYTMGRNIVFAHGQYSPWTDTGDRLLAHELTHAVQQRGESGTKAVARQMLQRDVPKDKDRKVESGESKGKKDAPAEPKSEECEQFPGGSTDCEIDPQTGIPTGKVTHQVDETNPCTRPCVEEHEAVHLKQLKTYCPDLRDCYKAADKGKRPVTDC